MYDLVCSQYKSPEHLIFILLSELELTKEDFGRFRDAYPSKDFKKVIVFTRTGGGNREEYSETIEALKKNKLYITDYDSELDSTYASFEFKATDNLLLLFNMMQNDLTETQKELVTLTGDEKLQKAIDALENL